MMGKPLDQKMQKVVLEFDDGTIGVFTGKAVCKEEDNRKLVSIKLTEPSDLPDGCEWGELHPQGVDDEG